MIPPPPPTRASAAPEGLRPHPRLKGRTVVLVGLMGVGKSTIGRGLASALQLPFRDADEEIERAARRTVAEIFAERGETEFRDGERRVIARLIAREPPHVLATGGGAFMDAETRTLARQAALCVWLKADIDVLARRVARKTTRPLLHGRDPVEVLQAHAASRYPFYAEAHVTVESIDASIPAGVARVMEALNSHVGGEAIDGEV